MESPVESHRCPGIARRFYLLYLLHSIGRDFPEWKEWTLGSASNVCKEESWQVEAKNLATLAGLCIWTLLLPVSGPVLSDDTSASYI